MRPPAAVSRATLQLVVVSGLSGAGKSVALHTLEDAGYYCIDNLPADLLPAFAAQMMSAGGLDYQRSAVGIDARNPSRALQRFPEILNELRAKGMECQLLFLEADDPILIKRFSETRRRHPLSRQDVSLGEAIARERELLGHLASSADLRVDTSLTSLHQLRDIVRLRVGGGPPGSLSVLFQSFGFKHGVPRDADFAFDTRCLPNPHWDPHLRPLTGLDAEVQAFLSCEPLVQEMLESLKAFLEAWIPRFQAESRAYLTIALGCTGGQHRSVYMADRLARHFRGQGRWAVSVRHRELS
jgi:UPF0042 nucleotide-binding protein